MSYSQSLHLRHGGVTTQTQTQTQILQERNNAGKSPFMNTPEPSCGNGDDLEMHPIKVHIHEVIGKDAEILSERDSV